MLVSELIKNLKQLDQNAQILVETWMVEDIRNMDIAFKDLSDDVLNNVIVDVESKGESINDEMIANIVFDTIDNGEK